MSKLKEKKSRKKTRTQWRVSKSAQITRKWNKVRHSHCMRDFFSLHCILVSFKQFILHDVFKRIFFSSLVSDEAVVECCSFWFNGSTRSTEAAKTLFHHLYIVSHFRFAHFYEISSFLCAEKQRIGTTWSQERYVEPNGTQNDIHAIAMLEIKD